LTCCFVAEVDGEPNPAEVSAAISSAVRREFELHVADVLLLGPQQTPKTASGRKQRTASRALWIKACEAPVGAGLRQRQAMLLAYRTMTRSERK
jgi:hypothetical protein